MQLNSRNSQQQQETSTLVQTLSTVGIKISPMLHSTEGFQHIQVDDAPRNKRRQLAESKLPDDNAEA